LSAEIASKRLGLLHDLPNAVRIAVLVNPANASSAETTLRRYQKLHAPLGLQIAVLNARTSREIEAAFATLVRDRADALFVASDAFFIAAASNLRRLPRAMGFPRPIPLAAKIDFRAGHCCPSPEPGQLTRNCSPLPISLIVGRACPNSAMPHVHDAQHVSRYHGE
jgi:hypothetical protein